MNNKPTLEQCEKISHLFSDCSSVLKEGGPVDKWVLTKEQVATSPNCPSLEEMMAWLWDNGKCELFRSLDIEDNWQLSFNGRCELHPNFEAKNAPEAFALACVVVDGLEK